MFRRRSAIPELLRYILPDDIESSVRMVAEEGTTKVRTFNFQETVLAIVSERGRGLLLLALRGSVSYGFHTDKACLVRCRAWQRRSYAQRRRLDYYGGDALEVRVACCRVRRRSHILHRRSAPLYRYVA